MYEGQHFIPSDVGELCFVLCHTVDLIYLKSFKKATSGVCESWLHVKIMEIGPVSQTQWFKESLGQ
jgi:hypothetical protein